MTIDPERRDELTRKYMLDRGHGFGVQDSLTAEQAAAIAWAEQTERTMRDLRQACEDYNGSDLAWLLWELPPPLRTRIDGARAQLREARARDGRDDGVQLVTYIDDRNKHDVANGWPAFDPNNPHHQTVPFGVCIWEPTTVHVLRGGTNERITAATPKSHQTFADEMRELRLDNMPDFGGAYDFTTFMARAEYNRMFRYCDVQVPTGCKKGIGGGDIRLIAVPTGQRVWVLSICERCTDALAEAQRDAHPEWVADDSKPYRPEVNIFFEAVYGAGRRAR